MFADLLPGAGSTRCMNRLHERLDAQAGPEVEGFRPAAGYGVEETRGFDRLQIVEAELMAGRDAEQAVGRMVRARLDAPEALTAPPITGGKEMQLVETLLAERESAFRPVDFEVVLHLAPGRYPVGLD
jgi:hypothetical protein